MKSSHNAFNVTGVAFYYVPRCHVEWSMCAKHIILLFTPALCCGCMRWSILVSALELRHRSFSFFPLLYSLTFPSNNTIWRFIFDESRDLQAALIKICVCRSLYMKWEKAKSKLVKSYCLSTQTPQRYGEILIAICLLKVLSQTKNISRSVPQYYVEVRFWSL